MQALAWAVKQFHLCALLWKYVGNYIILACFALSKNSSSLEGGGGVGHCGKTCSLTQL